MADDKKPKGKEEKPAAPAAAAAPAPAAPAKTEKPKPKAAAAKPKGGAKKLKSQKWKRYEITGEHAKKKARCCPKCGDGVFLAHHANRDSCGKCGYTEFRKV